MEIKAFVLLVVLLCIPAANSYYYYDGDLHDYDYDYVVDDLHQRVHELNESLHSMVRQHILQRLYIDERTRSEGDSGIKQVRVNRLGTKSYHSQTHTGNGVASIHNHANNKYTIGMGEVIAVINGVEFRTRHNDYPLIQPSKTVSDFHAYDFIDLPDVPPTVTDQPNVAAEIEEMRQYFKAFATQDTNLRDYKRYFKPVLCYMEGTWVNSEQTIEESFPSDRHFLNARSWFDMEEKMRFNAYSGSKETSENQAYLPTKVVGLVNGTIPKIAQWSYRIMCHPLADDLALDRFRVIDDLATRMERGGKTLEEFQQTRAARYQLNPKKRGRFRDTQKKPMYLDALMEEIPGMDNYNTFLTDNAYGMPTVHPDSDQTLNTANYHRLYKVVQKDAMGLQLRNRGFADQNMFVAMNTQENVVGMKLKDCDKEHSSLDYEDCPEIEQKWSYAIPLEIIYLTPLSNWNPYNLEYHENNKAPLEGGRNGMSPSTALKGTARPLFYQTPAEFFTGSNIDEDAADTTGENVWVEDMSGNAHLVRASGHSIFLPNISGVGIVRQRYPIAPLHGEGSMFRKELDALKDVVLRPMTNAHMFYESLDFSGGDGDDTALNMLFDTGPATPEYGRHIHRVEIKMIKWQKMLAGDTVTVTTEITNSHSHSLRVQILSDNDGAMHVLIYKCDDIKQACADGHTGNLIKV